MARELLVIMWACHQAKACHYGFRPLTYQQFLQVIEKIGA
jgi:hypothetical protein